MTTVPTTTRASTTSVASRGAYGATTEATAVSIVVTSFGVSTTDGETAVMRIGYKDGPPTVDWLRRRSLSSISRSVSSGRCGDGSRCAVSGIVLGFNVGVAVVVVGGTVRLVLGGAGCSCACSPVRHRYRSSLWSSQIVSHTNYYIFLFFPSSSIYYTVGRGRE